MQAQVVVADALDAEVGVLAAELAQPGQGGVGEVARGQRGEGCVDLGGHGRLRVGRSVSVGESGRRGLVSGSESRVSLPWVRRDADPRAPGARRPADSAAVERSSRPAACRSSSSSIAGCRPPGSRSACTSQKPMTARDVAISRPMSIGDGRPPRGHAVGDQPAERRQGGERRRRTRARRSSRGRRRPGLPSLASRSAASRSVADTPSRPRRRRRRPGRGPGRACPRSTRWRSPGRRPISRASCTARLPTPPAADVHDDGLPGRDVRTGAQQVPGRRALQRPGPARSCRRPRRAARTSWPGGQRLLRVAAAGQQRHHPAAVVEPADHLGARDERQRLAGEVVVVGLVGVGVVDAGRGDSQALRSPVGSGSGRSTSSSTSGPPNSRDLDRAHARTLPARTARDPERDRALGYWQVAR